MTEDVPDDALAEEEEQERLRPPPNMTAAHALVAIALVFALGLAIGFVLAKTL